MQAIAQRLLDEVYQKQLTKMHWQVALMHKSTGQRAEGSAAVHPGLVDNWASCKLSCHRLLSHRTIVTRRPLFEASTVSSSSLLCIRATVLWDRSRVSNAV